MWTYVAYQAPLHRVLQATILKWVAISSSRESSWPRDQTHISCKSPVLQADSLLLSPRKPDVCQSRKKSSRWRNYRGENMLYYAWRVPFFLNLASFFSSCWIFLTFLDLLLLPLSHSDCIPVYRVSLKISCPEGTVLEVCLAPQHYYHLGSATGWVIFWGADGLAPSVHCSLW